MVIEIPLTQGYVAIVDNCDSDLSEFKWTSKVGRGNAVYGYRNLITDGKHSTLRMHRVIMSRVLGRELAREEEVDHINLIGTDNRRDNLRLATRHQNLTNRAPHHNNQSGVKGVRWHVYKNKWQARINFNKKEKHLGYFVDINDAARAYNEAALALFGDFAWLNPIPVQAPEIHP